MDIVIIANAWAAARDNPTSKHQIARELVLAGHRVLWLEGAGMRRPSLGSGQDRGRIVRKLRASLRGAQRIPGADLARPGAAAPTGALWVLAPLLIPLPRYAAVRAFNAWLFRAIARAWCRRLDFTRPVLINYVPVLAGVMRHWRRGRPAGGAVVYHCVDRWDQFGMYDTALMSAMDRNCRAYAEVVIASSMALGAHCRADHANVHIVDHGVDYPHFARALAEPALPRPADCPPGALVGFIGLLSEWIDQALLVRLARAVHPASLVLIGKADVPIDALRAEPNIHILGPRPFAELPAYLGAMTVGLIPFQVSELTRAVNPIKLREMLAAGCPVVSTALPEVERYAGRGGVQVAADADRFVAAVRHVLASPLNRAARLALSAPMQQETWAAKVSEILARIDNASPPRGSR